ncbi:hypothetical protein FNO19_20685 [Salmonella enterica subsp. salamae]|nr:hypothetical protein [Salmonella enterica subsp. salamae]
MKEYILQAINDRWRVKITDAFKKCERVAALYLNDDLLNGALMSNIGGLLIRLRAVKGHISSVGGSMSDAFWYYIGCVDIRGGQKAHPRFMAFIAD